MENLWTAGTALGRPLRADLPFLKAIADPDLSGGVQGERF
jgi:hypothetical protein